MSEGKILGYWYDIQPNRWLSYYDQLTLLKKHVKEGSDVMNLGSGTHFIEKITPYQWKSMDLMKENTPTYQHDIQNTPYPIEPSRFQAVCAFQILEHVPYPQVGKVVRECLRIAPILILSVPNASITFTLGWKRMGKAWITRTVSMRNPRKLAHPWHYWEVGRTHKAEEFASLLCVHGEVISSFRSKMNPYHHFFVVKRKEELNYDSIPNPTADN